MKTQLPLQYPIKLEDCGPIPTPHSSSLRGFPHFLNASSYNIVHKPFQNLNIFRKFKRENVGRNLYLLSAPPLCPTMAVLAFCAFNCLGLVLMNVNSVRVR